MEKYFDLRSAEDTIKCKLYYPGKTAGRKGFRHVIVFCHGFAGHKDNAAAQKLAGRVLSRHDDTALLIFNWPGHGDDPHAGITLEDCDAYLSAVLEFVHRELRPEILDACATSFGGYLVLKYLTDHGGSPFRRICLRCPAVVMYDVLTKTILTPEDLETLAAGGSVPSGFDRKVEVTGAFLDSLRDAAVFERDLRPWQDRIRIVQGTADELVPFEAVRTFARRNGIHMTAVGDADHRFLDPAKMEIVIETFMDFLEV